MSDNTRKHHAAPAHNALNNATSRSALASDSGAVRSSLEVELKFGVSEDTPVPQFAEYSSNTTASTTTVTGPEVINLSAVYYDTDDLRLTRSRIVLRKRSGGKDAGWHLKLPGAGGRLELQAPMSDSPPAQLLAEIRALIGGSALVPIARVDNERHVYELHGSIHTSELPDNEIAAERGDRDVDRGAGSGSTDDVVHEDASVPSDALASDGVADASAGGASAAGAADTVTVAVEFVDDHVTATSLLPGGTSRTWREWEAELDPAQAGTAAGHQYLADIAEAAYAAGAFKAESPSKLLSALGDSIANAPVPPGLATFPHNQILSQVMESLARGYQRLLTFDPRVRRDERDAIHQIRVATRELRSLLSTFSVFFAPGATNHCLNELKWFAGVAGAARDMEVIAQTVVTHTQRNLGFVDPETSAYLDEWISADYQAAREQLLETMDNHRYINMLHELETFLARPLLNPLLTEGSPAFDSPADADLAAASDEAARIVAEAKILRRDTAMEEALYRQVRDAFGRVKRRNEQAFVAREEWQELGKTLAQHMRDRHGDVWPMRSQAYDPRDEELSQEIRASLTAYENSYHDVRKALKRVRYCVEALHRTMKMETGTLRPATKAAQDVLGNFQDAVTARDYLAQVASHTPHHVKIDRVSIGVLIQSMDTAAAGYLAEYPSAHKKVRQGMDALALTHTAQFAERQRRAAKLAKAARKAAKAKSSKAKGLKKKGSKKHS